MFIDVPVLIECAFLFTLGCGMLAAAEGYAAAGGGDPGSGLFMAHDHLRITVQIFA